MDQLRCLVVGNARVEKIVAQVLTDALGTWGHSVEQAWTVEEAFSHLNVDRFDVLILDGQDRVQAARAIKDASPGTFVILTTANVSLREVDGADAVLFKPFDLAELRAALPR